MHIKILTFITIKGSVLFDFGIVIFTGNALAKWIDMSLGKSITPTTAETAKQRKTATKR